MAEFRCRALKPTESEWFTIEAASANDAANSFHKREYPYYVKGFIYLNTTENNGVEKISFALIEVEDYEPVVSRIYSTGIWRMGGVKPYGMTLNNIACELGWKHATEDLLKPWEGEERWE